MTASATTTTSPVARLLGTGKRLPPRLRHEILAVGSAAVPALLGVLGNEALWLSEAPGEGWAPIHAVEILGEIRAADAVEPMLTVLERTAWNDYLHDAVIRVLPGLGAAVLEPALAAHARVQDEDFRHSVRAVLSELGVRDDRVLALLLDASWASSRVGIRHRGPCRAADPGAA